MREAGCHGAHLLPGESGCVVIGLTKRGNAGGVGGWVERISVVCRLSLEVLLGHTGHAVETGFTTQRGRFWEFRREF